MIASFGNVEAVVSFLCQDMGGSALSFYCAIDRERVKRNVLILNVSLANITLCCKQHVACKLYAGRVCCIVKKILKRFSGENDKYMAMFLSGT